MCMLCVEIIKGKLTVNEAERNFIELINVTDFEHIKEISARIDELVEKETKQNE